MIQRKEIIEKYFNQDGSSINYRFLTAALPDDQVILGMYKYLYKVVNNVDSPATPTSVDRGIKLYLTRNYVFYK